MCWWCMLPFKKAIVVVDSSLQVDYKSGYQLYKTQYPRIRVRSQAWHTFVLLLIPEKKKKKCNFKQRRHNVPEMGRFIWACGHLATNHTENIGAVITLLLSNDPILIWSVEYIEVIFILCFEKAQLACGVTCDRESRDDVFGKVPLLRSQWIASHASHVYRQHGRSENAKTLTFNTRLIRKINSMLKTSYDCKLGLVKSPRDNFVPSTL